MSLDFFVAGFAAPGGSKKVVFMRDARGRIKYVNGWPCHVIVDDGKYNRSWKNEVAKHARAYHLGEPFHGPLRLIIEFVMPRPKLHHVGNKRDNPLRDDRPRWHLKKPDTTKLIRAAEDAMTGIVYFDDSQIVQQFAGKRYAELGEPIGARILVTGPIDTKPQRKRPR